MTDCDTLPMTPHRLILILLFISSLTACGDTSSEAVVGDTDTGSGDTTGGGGADAGSDTSADSAMGGGDAGGLASCLEQLSLDTTLTLVPGDFTTQIHVATAFDGEGVWMIFNVADMTSRLFNVYGARLACDGSYLVEPFRIDEAPDWNKTDPSVAVNGDRMLVTWGSDSSCCSDNPNNLDINYRVFALDGTPISAEVRYEASRGGAPEPGNAFQAVPYAAPGGGFVIVGTLGHQALDRFQTFAQRIDQDGQLVGEAIDGGVAPGITQLYPAGAVAGDGTIHMAWTREEDNDAQYVLTSSVAPGATSASEPVYVRESSAASPSMVVLPGGNVPLIAMGALTAQGVDVGVKTPTGPETLVGMAGRTETSPALAVGDGGVGMVWYRNIRGIQNEVFVGRLDVDVASAVSLRGEAMIETDTPAGFYTPAITHIDGDVFFVAWSEGISPEFVIKGRFVSLP